MQTSLGDSSQPLLPAFCCFPWCSLQSLRFPFCIGSNFWTWLGLTWNLDLHFLLPHWLSSPKGCLLRMTQAPGPQIPLPTVVSSIPPSSAAGSVWERWIPVCPVSEFCLLVPVSPGDGVGGRVSPSPAHFHMPLPFPQHQCRAVLNTGTELDWTEGCRFSLVLPGINPSFLLPFSLRDSPPFFDPTLLLFLTLRAKVRRPVCKWKLCCLSADKLFNLPSLFI